MSETIAPSDQLPRGRSRRRRRWSAAEKAHQLAAFEKRGVSIKTFCAEAGIPRSSFNLWRQQARMAASTKVVSSRRSSPPTFAQVEVVPAAARPGMITLRIRTTQGVAAKLAGLDAAAAVTLVRAMLEKRGR
ncbi:MAG: IS66 family insertion sequence element accessory protein TnpA [Gemmatimonadaceae bacterium]